MKSLLEDLKHDFRGEILRQEPMSAHTSWKLGGPAELFLVPQDKSDLQMALRLVCRHHQPWMVLGNGSNLLVADRGIVGVVIHLGYLTRIERLPSCKVEVEAGVQLGELIKLCCRAGLGGLEELSGIPGVIGGALMMNAGALDSEIGHRVSQVFLTDGHGEWALRRDQIDFGYRYSGLEGQGVICSVVLQLSAADPHELMQRRKQVLARRKEVQKVTGAHAGSVFKNPPGEKAWQLIDKAGMRGQRKGNIQVSSAHCNHIVNLGGGRAEDLLALIAEVQVAVAKVCGIQLEREIRLVGFEGVRGQ